MSLADACDICQRLEIGCKLPISCVHRLAVMDKPFKQIAFNDVGPLPVCTNIGNKFILTIIDHCSHFPEAIPLVRHAAIDVSKALVSMFSRFDFLIRFCRVLDLNSCQTHENVPE